MNIEPIQLILADDHRMILAGLEALLDNVPDINVIATSTSGSELARLVVDLRPDAVVVNRRLRGADGVALTRFLRDAHPELKILALSDYTLPDTNRDWVCAGASACLSKELGIDELTNAIRLIMTGRSVSPAAETQPASEGRSSSTGDATAAALLSDREVQVLTAIANGMAVKQIAPHLMITCKTVETHRRNVMQKLNIDSVAGLTRFAIRMGITDA